MQIIGTKICARCKLVQNKLKEKGVNFEYKDIKDLPKDELENIMKKAEEKGVKSLPFIIADDKKELLTLQEVMTC